MRGTKKPTTSTASNTVVPKNATLRRSRTVSGTSARVASTCAATTARNRPSAIAPVFATAIR